MWNQYSFRTDFKGSPFSGTDDIWIRHRNMQEVLRDPRSLSFPHFAEWWDAWYKLPSLRPLVFGAMATVQAVQLGAIFITKIPAGEEVKPHDDSIGWHPNFYNKKLYIVLKTNSRVLNHCKDETVTMEEGSMYWFQNLVTHSIVNRGSSDRITLIICTRVE